jgi:ubiquinone/menaquinone biosynthesis C-methylase UbiE
MKKKREEILSDVKEFYNTYGIREWRRLFKDPYHQLEFNTTIYFLKKFLPKKGLVLDAGGGPGRYTIELAKLGYDVILLDLSPILLKIAKREIEKRKFQHRVKGIIEGSIDNLCMFKDNMFDAVICLGGVISHLTVKKLRRKAISELVRVCKKNSPIFVSVLSKLGILRKILIELKWIINNKKLFETYRDTGNYYGEYGFAPSHFYSVEELIKEFEKEKVKIIGIVGLEGLASGNKKELNNLFKYNSKGRKVWWETHLKTCSHSAVAEISEHFMLICKK